MRCRILQQRGSTVFRAESQKTTTKLLIAEDDTFFQKLLQELLSPYYELIIVSNGDEAWKELQRPNAPRMAILDWVMPGLSGPQICRKVRATESMASTYLILFTAKNNETDIVSGLRSGADDYITKPPLPAELIARIKVGERIVSLQDALQRQQEGGVREALSRGISLPETLVDRIEDRSFTNVAAGQRSEPLSRTRFSVEHGGRGTGGEERGIGFRVTQMMESRHFTR
jgi:DNA-binding response OmpR family regulator